MLRQDRKTGSSSLDDICTVAADAILQENIQSKQKTKKTKKIIICKCCLGKEVFSTFSVLSGRCLNDSDARCREY